MDIHIPKEVRVVAEALTEAGFDAYLVGGCVRDVLLKRKPKDWDLTTNARPEEMQKIFPESVYENSFGTVLVKPTPQIDADKDTDLHRNETEEVLLRLSASHTREYAGVVEVTTFRIEGKYTDKRHPDEIRFAKTIVEDLSRRDFTVNAMAYKVINDKTSRTNITPRTSSLTDPFRGGRDLDDGIIRAVGVADDRFREDALRLLRAVRFSAELGFAIEEKTASAIEKNAGLLEFVSKERIRDEFSKLLMAEGAIAGVESLRALGLLRFVMPELLDGVGVGQNKHHIFTVYEHNLKSLEYAVKKKFPLHLRLASLLHDIGKPRSKRGEGPNCTFYGHQVVGERMALQILDRLKFPREVVEGVALLVREHMFVYDPEMVTLAGVRRLLRRVGPENADDLIKVREADRIGSGVPKAQPYRLRHLQAMMEKVQLEPIGPKMLKLRGDSVMNILNIPPGPRVGWILSILLEEALDDIALNVETQLAGRVQKLGALTDDELFALAEKAKKKASAAQDRIDSEIKKKYSV